MSTVTVSDKGQVAIPATIRRRLGIAPGSKLDFDLEGDSVRIRLCKAIPPSQTADGYGLLRCELPGERRLTDFDVAEAMRNQDAGGATSRDDDPLIPTSSPASMWMTLETRKPPGRAPSPAALLPRARACSFPSPWYWSPRRLG